ncbi:MAG: hypothetical protein KJ884_11990 [Gammaproteobacteria bacterium]|nr:hypothetical protein [Gammaproteobacteria bacterium]MBU1490312.1 hypothetical protein [Gammaproteobacteria bacterium]MBU2064918.1 hypothetical protein [Gammaproteobacteria bacterium]MBU2139242.1 hypothetical protein [Gammaproteobacteria bacterium]MBU2215180.1 hypothetical protein [Gammaproteobacteria bacterium]
MKNNIFLLALIFPLSCLAVTPEINETIAYSGKLGKQNIFMTLSTTNGKVLGNYFYTKYNSPITLSGSLSDSKLLLIEETTNGTAHINAAINEGTISGTWALNGKSHNIHSKALSKSYENIIKKIDVSDKGNENKTLSITFIDGTSQTIEISTLEKSTLIIFEDFTFDGYPDMRILEIEAGGNSSFIYFDYDAQNRKFKISSDEISRLVSPKIFHSEKIIISISRDGCCTYHAIKISPTEVFSASYDFESKTGSEILKNKGVGSELEKPITENYFEDNYLNFKGTTGKN